MFSFFFFFFFFVVVVFCACVKAPADETPHSVEILFTICKNKILKGPSRVEITFKRRNMGHTSSFHS